MEVCCRCEIQLPYEFMTENGYCKTCEIDYISSVPQAYDDPEASGSSGHRT